MNTKLIGFIILGVVLIGIGIWQFGGSNTQEQEAVSNIKIEAPGEQPTITPPTSAPQDTGEPSSAESGSTTEDTEQVVAAVTKITIEGDEFSFAPANISVTRGTTVELTFKNIGKAPHNYSVTELGLATKTIGGGKTDVVTFVAPSTPGTISYTSFCSVPGHREAGMVGTIEIK